MDIPRPYAEIRRERREEPADWHDWQITNWPGDGLPFRLGLGMAGFWIGLGIVGAAVVEAVAG